MTVTNLIMYLVPLMSTIMISLVITLLSEHKLPAMLATLGMCIAVLIWQGILDQVFYAIAS
jgi:positive regulator of sigma E activity